MNLYQLYEHCVLCPRACGANRLSGQTGFCGADASLLVGRAALHAWEEPPISGKTGSGAVFFGHCTMQCVFCQNRSISRRQSDGTIVSAADLATTFLSLQQQGAQNINLVTPTHYLPHILDALQQAKTQGLSLPVVYNCGGYESTDTLKLLQGYVDIFLPDLKYYSAYYAGRYSATPDYFETAIAAIEEMLRQTGTPVFSGDGRMLRGVIIRHLMLPTLAGDSRQVLRAVAEHFGDRVLVSLMRQYTPMDVPDYPELQRKITQAEYEEACEYFSSLGLRGFFQDEASIDQSFIPAFDGTGVIHVQ